MLLFCLLIIYTISTKPDKHKIYDAVYNTIHKLLKFKITWHCTLGGKTGDKMGAYKHNNLH